jgi:hypothetical protein
VKLPHSHKYSHDLREMFSRVFLEPLLNNMSSDGGQVNPCYPNQASKDGIEAAIVCHEDAARGFAVLPYHIDALRTQSIHLTGVIPPDQYQYSCKQQIPRFDIKACTQCQWSKVIRQRIHLLWSATVAKKTTRGAGSLLCCQLISKIVHIVPTTIGRFPSSHGQEIK